jgi:hypothetical protein
MTWALIERRTKWIAFVLPTREVLDSNTDSKTGYPDWDFSWFSSLTSLFTDHPTTDAFAWVTDSIVNEIWVLLSHQSSNGCHVGFVEWTVPKWGDIQFQCGYPTFHYNLLGILKPVSAPGYFVASWCTPLRHPPKVTKILFSTNFRYSCASGEKKRRFFIR